MGRELVFKKIKKSAIGLIISGVLFTLLAIMFAFIYAMDDALVDGLFIIVIFLLLGVPFLVLGIRDLVNPMKNGIFKRNPYVLEQADNMIAHKMYEDKYIMLSDRCIASKKSITDISYLEDVFLVYIQKQSTNFIPTGKYLTVCTATGDFNINIYGSSKAAINELVSRISMICPNASLGYSNEGLAYLRQMKEIYKNNNGMIEHRGYTQNSFVLPQYINNVNNQNTYNQNTYN
ncbi:MAG: hypothetical protein J6J16_02435 [Lachnospiraceae bacterium]|nr:hypothetical protein [Lachnospiraceae bacterium]